MQSKAQLRKLSDEEKLFKRRLLSVHQRFADVPDNVTVIVIIFQINVINELKLNYTGLSFSQHLFKFQGQNHIYLEDGQSIYRAALAHGKYCSLSKTFTSWSLLNINTHVSGLLQYSELKTLKAFFYFEIK